MDRMSINCKKKLQYCVPIVKFVSKTIISAGARAYTDLQTRFRHRLGSAVIRLCRCFPFLPSQSSLQLRPPIRYPKLQPLPRRPTRALSPPVQWRPFHNTNPAEINRRIFGACCTSLVLYKYARVQ